MPFEMYKHECAFCELTFKLNVELKIHMKKDHHGMDPQQQQHMVSKFNALQSEKSIQSSKPSNQSKVDVGSSSQTKDKIKFKLSLNSVIPVLGDGIIIDNASSSSSRSDKTEFSEKTSSTITSFKRSWKSVLKRQSSESSEYENDNIDDDYDEEQEGQWREEPKESMEIDELKSTTENVNGNEKKHNRKSTPQKLDAANKVFMSDGNHVYRIEDGSVGIGAEPENENENIKPIPENEARTTCAYCKRILSNMKNLILHQRKYHPNEAPVTTFIPSSCFSRERPRRFNCKKCRKTYESYNQLWIHRIKSCGLGPKYECKFCCKQYKQLSQATECERLHSLSIKDKSKNDLQSHRQEREGKKINSRTSPFNDRSTTENSSSTSSSGLDKSNKCIYKKCFQQFKIREELMEHAKIKHGFYMCLYCNSVVFSSAALDKHYATRHPHGAAVKEENHQEVEEGGEGVDNKRRSCDLNFNDSGDAVSNLKIKKEPIFPNDESQVQTDTTKKEELEEQSSHICLICNTDCYNSLALEIHTRKHQKSYKCAICPQSFPEKNELEDHIKNIHHIKKENKSPQHSNMEGKAAKTSLLKPTATRKTCGDCGETFRKTNEYIQHRKQHTMEMMSDTSSSTVETDDKMDREESLTDGSSKRSSRRVHSKKAKDEYNKCGVCQTEFSKLYHYQYHIEQGLCKEKVENEYECDQCSQTFRRLATLENHKKQVHEEAVQQKEDEDAFISYNIADSSGDRGSKLSRRSSDASSFKKPREISQSPVRKRSRKYQESPPAYHYSDEEETPSRKKKIARIQPQSQDKGYIMQVQHQSEKCVECGATFASCQELAMHLLDHNKVKMRQAEVSEQKPAATILRASRKTGVSQVFHKCPVCGLNVFKLRKDMISHVKQKHKRVGEYGCPYSSRCKTLSKTALELCEHVYRHEKQEEDQDDDMAGQHGEQEENTAVNKTRIIKNNKSAQPPPRFQEKKPKINPNQSRSRIQIKANHSITKKTTLGTNSSTRRPIPCPVCKKELDSRLTLKMHIQTKHPDRDYQFCPTPECSVLFHDAAGLKRHLAGQCVI